MTYQTKTIISVLKELQEVCVFEPPIDIVGKSRVELDGILRYAATFITDIDKLSKTGRALVDESMGVNKILSHVSKKRETGRNMEQEEIYNAERAIKTLLEHIGEDPNRDGLKETPRRVIKSYQELFSGIGKAPKDLFTVFDDDKYDQMVVLKDIEMYSMCEHHMLPFHGRAHIAYIPEGGKVVGISKLARLLDLFARRLQIQERIGYQVTEALMEFLKPAGAACVIEASHMCMCARGVGKQNSVMVTSSLTGVFKSDPAVRQEFMNLIAKS